MRFIAFLSLLCVGLVCSTPVDTESDRDVEYVDAGESRREPDVRDMEGADGGDPQRRFPVVILDTPMFRPVDDGGFDSDEDGFDNFPLQPQFPPNDFYYRRLQQQLEEMRRFQQFIMNMFRFRRPLPPPRFPPGFFDFDGFGNFSGLPPNYDNSTYSTKNINGTIVSVNETIKKVDNNETSFVFHVKTVQLRPENETAGSDDGLTIVETGEEVDLLGEGGTNSTEGAVETSSEPSNAIPVSSESSSVSPVATENTVATTESDGGAGAGSGNATDDPSANDVNLARRFRRYALKQ